MSDSEEKDVVATGTPGAEEATAAKKKRNRKKKASAAEAADGVEVAAETEKPKAEASFAPQERGAAAGAAVEEADEDGEDGQTGNDASAAKKKKNKKKKKAGSTPGNGLPEQDNSILRCLGNWRERPDLKQTWPPTQKVTVAPVGQLWEYEKHEQGYRTTSAEKKELEKLHEEDYDNFR
eukprot:g811.t1